MDSGAPDKSLIRVTIFQQPYTLRSSGEAGETEALAKVVDQLMNQIAGMLSTTDPTRVAVLTSLHLADRVRALERQIDAVKGRVAALDEQISTLLPLPDEDEERR